MKCQQSFRTDRTGRVRTGGFSYIEIIFSVLILSIAVSSMISAYSPAIFSGNEQQMAVFANRARGTLNRLVCLEYGTLNNLVRNNLANPVDLTALFGSGAETFTFQGRTYTPIATITNQGGSSGGLLELTVRIQQVEVRTLKSDY
jgi:type II secretory pathway pseudopilin PulG